MRTLVVGGYGQFGLSVASHLADSERIEEVTIAGRDLAVAQAAASELGPKASALRLDAADPVALREAVDGHGLVLDLLPEPERYQASVIRAAIDAGAHFCGVHRLEPDATLHAPAVDAGVTILHGAGFHPGFVDLVARLADERLDEPERVVDGLLFAPLQGIWTDLYSRYIPLPDGLDRGAQGQELPALLASGGSPEALLGAIRDARVVEMWVHWLSGSEASTVTVPAFRDGLRMDADPLVEGVDLPVGDIHGEHRMTTVPALVGVPMDHLQGRSGAARTFVRLSGFAAPFDRLVRDGVDQIRSGAADFETVVRASYRALAADLPSFLLPERDFVALPGTFRVVYGLRNGRPARAAAWSTHDWWTPGNWVDMTSANVALSALRLLRGEIEGPGLVRVAEADRLDDAYLRDLVRLLPEAPRGEMVGTLLEHLDP
jgi:hypothetical protein